MDTRQRSGNFQTLAVFLLFNAIVLIVGQFFAQSVAGNFDLQMPSYKKKKKNFDLQTFNVE